ncbi:MAG TPA: helix-turn-helix domain-containing protein [Candidatus Paceibacterota bacterium]|nr:helix-turn-helix domain-containing protein [Candidatus Paceibacterota bacterium]
MNEIRAAGLTENESKIYLALLDLGPSLAGQISQKTGMHRRTVYDTIEMLIKKGLVGYILKNNRHFFQASNPERILEIIKEKEKSIESILPLMKEKFVKTREKEETNFYKGKEGLKTVFEDQLNSKEILIMGASPKAYEVLQFYFNWYDKIRKEKKIKARIIAQDKRISKIPLAEIRYLPEKYANPVSVNIYGDKIAIILWATFPIAIVIKNKEMSEGYKKYFELMWNIAR